MSEFRSQSLVPFIIQLFVGTVCNSMIVPFMGFFIVDELGREPWTISVYAGGVALLATVTNRAFGRLVDEGRNPFVFIGVAVGGFMMGAFALVVSPTYWTVLTFGIVGFGVSTSAMSTMFSLGGNLAERRGLNQEKINAYMRATTSTAWMVGPAITFTIADRFGASAVFNLCASLSIVWAALWWWATPETHPTPAKEEFQGLGAKATKQGLWLAVTYVFCLSSAHSLTFSALPLFYIQEVGLPGYAPGVAFSMKTLVEVVAIFSTPFLIAKFGLRSSLLVTTLIAAATLLYIPTVQNFSQMLVGAAMEGLYYGLYSCIGISFIQSFAHGRSARATALYWNTLIISGVLAGPVTGLVAQLYSFRAVIYLAFVVAVLAIVTLLMGSKPRNLNIKL